MSLVNYNKILTWADFPNRLPEPPPGAATTESASIGVSWRYDIDEFVRKGNAIGIKLYTVEIYIVPEDCAVRASILTGDRAIADALLRHEQGHYDIIAIGAREFHNRLAALSDETEYGLRIKIRTLNGQVHARSDGKDALYDTQTNHSINTQQQTSWSTAIATQKRNANGNVDNLPT